MTETSVALLLCAKTGIDFRTTSPKVLARVIRKRMEASGVGDESGYLALLKSSEQEMTHLIESLVVPETWFFRDFEPFVYLGKIILAHDIFPRHHPLRVLSIPTSTGEEAYSIAITLMEAGLKPEDFHVDAVDISRQALDKAVLGVYGRSSFREKDEGFRLKYFSKTESGLEVVPEVRAAVRFLQGNILDCASFGVEASYDIVFFRNLLVYLNEEARKQAVRNVDRLLSEEGMLFLGFAEPPHIFFPNYIPADHPRSYAAQKPKECAAGDETAHGSVLSAGKEGHGIPERPPGAPRRKTTWRRSRPEPEDPPRENIPQASPAGGATGAGDASRLRARALDHARELADRGMLAKARHICVECLEADATCEEAHYLLGVIALAENNEDLALEHFSKVIYLKPDHVEVLVHLSLLMDKKGLREQAAGYRKRLDRLRRLPPA